MLARGAVNVFGLVVVTAAARGRLCFFGFAGNCHVLRDVAKDVAQAPRVGLFLSNRMSLVVGVVEVPGDLVELFGMSIAAGAAGVFPLGLGRQAILSPGLLA